jgi:hypothetical protein
MLRSSFPTRIGVALGLVLALSAGPASAQAPARSIRDELPPPAQAAWDSAKKFYDARQYDGAAEAYKRAYELSKNPRVLFNEGVCQKNLQHYARALMIFRQALADGAGKLSADETKSISAAAALLEGYTTTFTLTSNEDGAVVLVDDYPVGTTPLPGPVPIDPGEGRVIVLHKEGFEDARQTVRVDQTTQPKLTFTLVREGRKTPVHVTVLGPPHAIITIDGKDLGEDRFADELPAGPHTFEARAQDYVPLRQSATVVYGEPLNLTLTLVRERHEALLRVTAEPQSATIAIDGKPVGSGSFEGRVSTVGGRQLTVRKSGYHEHVAEVVLADDQTRDIQVTLVPEKSGLVYWIAGTAVVVAGVAVLSYFLFKPADQAPVTGTFSTTPNPVPATWRFR